MLCKQPATRILYDGPIQIAHKWSIESDDLNNFLQRNVEKFSVRITTLWVSIPLTLSSFSFPASEKHLHNEINI